MTFGLTDAGFEMKRLDDVLSENRTNAVPIFQDLVGVNDVVDTSDSSTIGRFINLFSVPQTEVWEQLQLLYSSFDPNTATGIALDNLVQYLGLSRNRPSYSIVSLLLEGDRGTTIPLGSSIGSSIHNNVFITTAPLTLDLVSTSRITVSVNSVTNTTAYTISYTTSSTGTNTVTYTSDSSATETEILNGLRLLIISAHPTLSASIVGASLIVEKENLFESSTFSVTPNIDVDKVAKLVNAQCDAIGTKQAEAGSLNVIKTPVLGWDTSTNPLPADSGSELETDEQLRLRFRNTKFTQSSNILDSLYSDLSNLTGVSTLTIYENDTDVTDSNGLPAHSFNAVILGGLSEEIAETIWLNKPTGISSVGNVAIEIIDSQNFPRDIRFTRPDPVVIYITVNLTTNSSYPADGADKIKSAIIDYAEEQFSVGDEIVYSRLYTPINTVGGHQINSLFIGTSPSPVGTANIPIAFDEIGSFSSVNIIVTV